MVDRRSRVRQHDGAHFRALRYRHHPPRGSEARAQDPAGNRQAASKHVLPRGLAVVGVERSPEAGAYLLGTLGMKIDKIVLRQIRMPLVHFFETSFGRTTERDIILVEAHGRRRIRLGRGHRGRKPVLQRRVDRIGVADPARLRRAARARRIACERRRCRAAHRTHPRPSHGARRSGSGHLGPGSAAEQPAAVAANRRRRAARDSVRRLHRHSGIGAAASGEDRARAGRRLPAHQDEDQAGLGRGRGPPGARAISFHQADGGRQFGVHAEGRRSSQAARRFLSDDDRAAAGARRHHRSRRAAGEIADADLSRRVHPLGASCRAGHPAARLRHHQYQAGARRRISRGKARPRRRRGRRHSGLVRRHAGGGHRPGAQHRALHAAAISLCRAMSRRASATGSATSSARRSKPPRAAPSRFATSPVSATRSTTTFCANSPCARCRQVERELPPLRADLGDGAAVVGEFHRRQSGVARVSAVPAGRIAYRPRGYLSRAGLLAARRAAPAIGSGPAAACRC